MAQRAAVMIVVVQQIASMNPVPGPVPRPLCGPPHFTLSKILGKNFREAEYGSQNMVPGPAAAAASGNLLQMQVLGLHHRLTE